MSFLKSLIAFLKAGLSIAQSDGQITADSNSNELDLALVSREVAEAERLVSSGGRNVWVVR